MSSGARKSKKLKIEVPIDSGDYIMSVESGGHRVAFTPERVEELLRPELEVRQQITATLGYIP